MSLQRLLFTALFTPISKGRWGLPICFWGEPGVAKSALIEEVAATIALYCEVLSPGERGEGAFGCVPVPKNVEGCRREIDRDGESVLTFNTHTVLTYPAPEWAEKMGDGGVLFLDELTTAPPAIRPALLGLINDRRIGGSTLNGRVRVVAAANPPELVPDCYELPSPVMNRMGHIDWPAPTVEEHASYMMRASTGNGGHVAPSVNASEEEARVLAAWPDAWAWAVGLETAFLRARPAFKNLCPGSKAHAEFIGSRKASKLPIVGFEGARGWPSDRSWELATRALAGAKVHSLDGAETEQLVAAFIGAGVAEEFFAWVAEQDLPAPADLLDGRTTFVPDHSRVDRTHAVFSGCATLLTAARCDRRVARKDAFYAIVEAYAKAGVALDVAAASLQVVCSAPAKSYAKGEGDGGNGGFLFKQPTFARAFAQYMHAAGVIGKASRST